MFGSISRSWELTKGSFRVLELKQPDKTPLPSELPEQPSEAEQKKGAFTTPGDKLRPRWETQYSPDAVMSRWNKSSDGSPGVTLGMVS